ncbi:MobF family relaxase [Kitasatospora cineracea]|uniref:Conjugative relaxase-like TrwC/TraI family protein n=1 Tax=Kitasatospora cineracea TaxID=88074 RepID=A0A8G1UNB3_9ACTN|nr:MobF family relaxase [Kitasatospora cineracea]ROR44762.1 conjugative relaxase-like TrwC/TraI family protein [Kitasatospora cineracea]
MTIHKLTAGNGYTYLTRQVAGGDVQRQRGQSAEEYYTQKGNPAGVWLGRGAPLLGLDGTTVTEQQMKHLFGLGQHPDAERIIAEHLAANVRADMDEDQLKAVQAAAIKAATLGRKYPEYEPLDPFAERVERRLAVIEKETRRTPTSAEVKKVQQEESRRQRAAVAGFDLVFAPVKSAAVLWALDERPEVRAAVREAHEAARDAALELLEEHAAHTRTGSTGQAQIDTKGLVAVAFDHYDSRAGDPNLHTHVVIANKIQGADGKWRSLDARGLLAMTVATSEFYNSRFETELTARLGVTFEAREDSATKRQPVREIAGVPTEALTHFSSRRTEIEARYEQLLREYRRDHGHDPSRGMTHQLARQANLDTREGKKAARSLEEMRADWTHTVTTAHGQDIVQRVMAAVPAPESTPATARQEEPKPVEIPTLAAAVITAVGEERAVWTVWNLRAHAERLARSEHPTTSTTEHRQLVEAIVTEAVSPAHSIRVDAPALLDEPEELRRANGDSVFVRHASTRYTSTAILDAERRLVDAALTPVNEGLNPAFVGAAIDGFEARNRALDEGQRALVTAFATDTRLVSLGLGPAGSGKTTAMQAYVHVANQAGQRVVPLATSAASAAVLARDLGQPAENLHKFLWEHTGGTYAAQLSSGQNVPSNRAGFVLNPGDVVLVDEAGMAGTLNLDRLTRIAAEHGASVRLLGDYRQLGSVEAGGALRLIAAEAGAVELTTLHRFSNQDEATATLKIRTGDAAGLDFYFANQRVVSGSRTAMVEAAYDGWKADMLAGRTTLISARTGTDVTALSARAREDRVAAGQVETDGVLLRDGNRAGRGDWIVTRENNRKITTNRGADFVKNGDAWQVLKRYEDGSLKVRHLEHRGRLTLPAEYVAANVQLLYASTITRSQGGTVDTAHPLVTDDTTREELYVQLSRARHTTTLYTATHDLLPFDTDEQLDQPKNDPNSFAAREVLERVLGREGAQLSATETIRGAQEDAVSLATLAPRHQHAVETLTAPYYHQLIHRLLGPALAEQITTDDAMTAVTRALRTAEADGWQPERLLAAATWRGDLNTADSPAQALAWRLNTITEDRPAPAHLNAPTTADTTRYAALVAQLTGLPAHRLVPETATTEPAALRIAPAAAQAADAHPHVSTDTLNRYATTAASTLNTTTDKITAHPQWPHLAGALAAAERTGRDTTTLLTTAATQTTSGSDPVTALTRAARTHLATDGIPEHHQQAPEALRHQALAATVLGNEHATRALGENTWPALTAALRRAETAGHEPAVLLRQVAEQRPLTGADSLSQVLAWRIGRHLAANTPATAAQQNDRAETELWRTLAWTLKAIESTGTTAETTLTEATGRTSLPELLQHAQQQALAHTRAASGRADLPAWISPVPLSIAANPRHHDYLSESTTLIANRVSVLGDRTVENRPEWSRTLGEAPTDPTLRTQWEKQLAVVAAYRDQYRVTDDNAAQPAGPYIEESRTGHHAYWQAAEAAIAARRIATAPSTPAAATADSDQRALRRLAADVYRTLPEAEQAEVLRAVAVRTGASWLVGRPRLDEAALAQQHVAESVSMVLAERRQLTAEAAQPVQQEIEDRRQPTLAERRRAGRQAERQAHRDQLQQRGGQPGTRTARPAPNRRVEPIDQRQAPAQRPAEQRQPLQPRPQQIQQDQQGPRLR